MLTIITAAMYLICRITQSVFLGYMFMAWVAYVGIRGIIYVLQWNKKQKEKSTIKMAEARGKGKLKEFKNEDRRKAC